MTRNTFFKAMMIAIFAIASVNTYAQHRGGREMHFHNGGMRMEHAPRIDGPQRGYDGPRGYYDAPRHAPMAVAAPHHAPAPVAVHHSVPSPRFDRYGYLPGWEGRVRYMDGRYGYLRGNDWYWYDTYYEPDFYYAHPVGHFHHVHLTRTGRAVATAVAGAAILGGIISVLAE